MKQIIFQRPRDDNFTPRSLMRDYAKEANSEYAKIVYGVYGELYLKLSGKCYKYDHWQIDKLPGKIDRVTMILTEVQ